MKPLSAYFDEPLYTNAKVIPAILRFLVRIIFRPCFRWKKEGFETIDEYRARGENAIIAANHLSFTDPVFLLLCMDFKVRFMARANFFDDDRGFFERIFGRLLAIMGAFPVKPHTADLTSTRRALKTLKRGEWLGIFPEGSRKMMHEPDEPDTNGGVGLLATMADKPIFPIALIGPDKIRPLGQKLIHFPKVRIVALDPVFPKDYAQLPKDVRYQAMADEVMHRIREVTGETDAWAPITAKA